MKNETPKQRLVVLKKKYKNKYLTPLLFKFTRPPIMFDREQVNLVKQIKGVVKNLEDVYLCPNCNGLGVKFKKNEDMLKEDPPWNSTGVGRLFDNRMYLNDPCMNCFGEGIVFPKNNCNSVRNGIMVSGENISELVCDTCCQFLDWNLKFTKDHCFYVSKCCGIEYKLFPAFFNVEVRRKSDGEKERRQDKMN